MCIIVAKQKGSDFPSLQTIINCMDRNRDGFAMAWNGPDGHIHNFQTMDSREAARKYSELSSTLDPARTGFIFHARIATHGSKKVENCHCWTSGDLAFAHNGILRNITPREDLTDSETLFRDYLVPVLKATKDWNLVKKLADALACGTNKFAFLAGTTGNILLTGDFIKYSEDGAKGVCYYSNTSFHGSLNYYGSLYGNNIPAARPKNAQVPSVGSVKRQQYGRSKDKVLVRTVDRNGHSTSRVVNLNDIPSVDDGPSIFGDTGAHAG